MLTRIRIEVEEPSAHDCQGALDDYEAQVLNYELWRHRIAVGAHVPDVEGWAEAQADETIAEWLADEDDPDEVEDIKARRPGLVAGFIEVRDDQARQLHTNAPSGAIIDTANAMLGREITEEVIELRDDQAAVAGEGAFYAARRVVRLTRLDTRRDVAGE